MGCVCMTPYVRVRYSTHHNFKKHFASASVPGATFTPVRQGQRGLVVGLDFYLRLHDQGEDDGYESVCSYIRRMIHESPMSWVARPLEPFMIHAGFAPRLIGGQTPMYHKYKLAMLGGVAVNTCYDTCSSNPPSQALRLGASVVSVFWAFKKLSCIIRPMYEQAFS